MGATHVRQRHARQCHARQPCGLTSASEPLHELFCIRQVWALFPIVSSGWLPILRSMFWFGYASRVVSPWHLLPID